MNILAVIDRLKEIALEHPEAYVAGFDWVSEDFTNPANHIEVQTDQFDNTTAVCFEYQKS